MLTSIIVYMILGVFVGLLAGLLGVGGGLIVVPIITYSFAIQGIETAYAQQMAVGTSLGTIMFTSVSSFMTHHKNRAVLWPVFAQITPGILIGTFAAAYVAMLLPAKVMKIFFIAFVFYSAAQMILNVKPKPSRDLPGRVGNALAGCVIGMISGIVGIGGGLVSVPYMTWCNVPIHKAIGTSAAIGFPIAVAGAIGYVYNGLQVTGLPDHSFGFIYLPALFGIAVISVLTAPIGAKISSKLPVPKLKKAFACLLIIIGSQMLYALLS